MYQLSYKELLLHHFHILCPQEDTGKPAPHPPAPSHHRGHPPPGRLCSSHSSTFSFDTESSSHFGGLASALPSTHTPSGCSSLALFLLLLQDFMKNVIFSNLLRKRCLTTPWRPAPYPLASDSLLLNLLTSCIAFITICNDLSPSFSFYCLPPLCIPKGRNLLWVISAVSQCLEEYIDRCSKNIHWMD